MSRLSIAIAALAPAAILSFSCDSATTLELSTNSIAIVESGSCSSLADIQLGLSDGQASAMLLVVENYRPRSNRVLSVARKVDCLHPSLLSLPQELCDSRVVRVIGETEADLGETSASSAQVLDLRVELFLASEVHDLLAAMDANAGPNGSVHDAAEVSILGVDSFGRPVRSSSVSVGVCRDCDGCAGTR